MWRYFQLPSYDTCTSVGQNTAYSHTYVATPQDIVGITACLHYGAPVPCAKQVFNQCLLVAVEGEDYTLGSPTVTFPDTSDVGSAACTTFTIVDDSILELDQQFEVQIVTPTNPANITLSLPSSTTTVTIMDNDSKCTPDETDCLSYNLTLNTISSRRSWYNPEVERYNGGYSTPSNTHQTGNLIANSNQ